ncbi:uncharacterized protein N7511_001560 [Penicillium nucicola]|uniref:uncharacterized protein n=1 Tax=Penicillium nucicola TaxID=1850975 RepID=UPI002545288F|nr:uncharacterized protein N7511_001560 [Penicillium nucicola]KAJ5776549.1 hypothetical protein N7511_001560 [Penicillium nucicola]
MFPVSIDMGSDESIYLLKRDEAETERLNNQHRFLVKVAGNILHPSIPTEDITAVADLGTGTGIWLEDVANSLPNKSVYLHGFDISSAQYPPGNEIHRPGRSPIPLSVHDALYPFPVEHHGRYDLVHIRLLTAGLQYSSYAIVLQNARELLSKYIHPFIHPTAIAGSPSADSHTNTNTNTSSTIAEPNGYLQWEEVDHTAFCTDSVPEIPAITQLRQSVIGAMLKLGLWPFAPQRVHHQVSAGGFRDIRRVTYTTVGNEGMRGVSQKWVAGVIRALVPASMVVTGEATDEGQAREVVERLVEEFDDHCVGARVLVNFGVIVGRRCD